MLRMSVNQFEEVVAEALGEIPADLAERVENVTVMVEDEPQRELLVDLGMDPDEDLLFGLYEGVALPERAHGHAREPPCGGVVPPPGIPRARELLGLQSGCLTDSGTPLRRTCGACFWHL